ncbi:aldehyde dehydrogenase [Litorimonas cladophorae]|uniref:Aldehyde dehydrogenase n=1 Tax=Litorimonas cladophorae TaxID=1220491 RepID=A0A918NJD3_9PROT|nr:coniferyl aldehyde dehydrogenase [Litorimonas cladophorae]GGX71751.1 aldehyde dehydrogenase [Litorimonas cladophorae]
MVRINPDKPVSTGTTKPAELDTVLAAQRAAFNKNPNSDWASRKAKLVTLRELILGHEAEFIKAISDDFGNRAAEDTLIAECLVIQGGISHAIKHTPKWMKTRKAPTALQYLPAKNVIIPQPLGVIGIISPWNYPLQLAVMPLVGALGAGNRAMIKPSEYTPRFSQLLKEVLAKGFTDEEVFVATGGVDVASAFSNLTFDHLVFTGSTSVGRMVGKAAGANLVPVTLELGGKSPVIIDESAKMDMTVARIANGKLLNAGQTCVAPDYVLMPEAKINAFSDAMIAKAEEFFPTVAGNPDYTSIIADGHYARLQDLLEDAENKGATIRVAGDDDKQQLAKERRVPLTVVTNTTPDMKIMQEEIFGPLLPVVASETLDDSLDTIQKGERPLALYWFGENKGNRDKVLRETISGGVSINETAWHVVQEDIPFGGVGPSGMGAYHGEAGFQSFSHMKGVFIQSKFSQGKNLFPPYTNKTRKMIGLMKKIL